MACNASAASGKAPRSILPAAFLGKDLAKSAQTKPPSVEINNQLTVTNTFVAAQQVGPCVCVLFFLFALEVRTPSGCTLRVS